MKDIVLKGKKVTLRPIKISDAKELSSLVKPRDKKYYAFASYPSINVNKTKEIIKEYLLQVIKGKALRLVIVLNKTRKIVGKTGLRYINQEHRTGYIETWIAKEFWGTGVNTEAKKLLLDYIFKKLKLHRVSAGVCEKNVRSIKAIEKLGAVKEGILRENSLINGKYFDQITYGILDREWLKKKQ
ncbi:MAG: GNAT family protein [archaeon]